MCFAYLLFQMQPILTDRIFVENTVNVIPYFLRKIKMFTETMIKSQMWNARLNNETINLEISLFGNK